MAQLTIQQAFDLALQHHHAGRMREAEELYWQVLAQQPEHAEATHYLGVLTYQEGHYDIAVDLIRRAIALRPDYAEAYSNLGNVLRDQGQLDDAIAAHRQAVALRPSYAQAHYNLGCALRDQGQLDAAVAAMRQAIALRPNYADAHNNLGNALKDVGQLDAAIAAFGQAIALRPNYAQVHSNLVYTLHFHPDYTGRQILEASRAWAQAHERPLAKQILPHANDPTPQRRLRIGYVSPDFREHCQSFFMLGLLAHHNHQAFEIAAYSSVRRGDAFTDRLRSHVDVWHDIAGLSDAQAADKIRADRIDILVDLTLHMAQNRLLLFCRKPAPVQMTWLGYPGTTGLSAMDYRLSDPFLDPPGQELPYSEKTLWLPHCFWCYEPIVPTPEVNDLPAAKTRTITFGCLNTFAKTTMPARHLWARVLQAVPGARMQILAPVCAQRQAILDLFAGCGIAAQRIEFINRLPYETYFRQFHQIDLALDPIPYPGHTTTLDALWMGIPVVSLAGSTAVSRGGVTMLSNVGLTDLITHSPDEYVAVATALANDLPRLAELRRTLRSRMQSSPLMDAPCFARNVETLWRDIWRQWCADRNR